MTIFIGADHGGFELKEALKQRASDPDEQSSDFYFEDMGAAHLDPADDYPQFGFAVADQIVLTSSQATQDSQPTSWGVLVCRSGGGISIAANRRPGVRAVVCRNESDVEHARRHNNANVLVLEGDRVSADEAWRLLQLFISTPFDGGRHSARVQALG